MLKKLLENENRKSELQRKEKVSEQMKHNRKSLFVFLIGAMLTMLKDRLVRTVVGSHSIMKNY